MQISHGTIVLHNFRWPYWAYIWTWLLRVQLAFVKYNNNIKVNLDGRNEEIEQSGLYIYLLGKPVMRQATIHSPKNLWMHTVTKIFNIFSAMRIWAYLRFTRMIEAGKALIWTADSLRELLGTENYFSYRKNNFL